MLPTFLLCIFLLLPKVGTYFDLSLLPLLLIFIYSLSTNNSQSTLKYRLYWEVSIGVLLFLIVYSCIGAAFSPDSSFVYIFKFVRYLILVIVLLFSFSRSFLTPIIVFRASIFAAFINLIVILLQYSVFIFDFHQLTPYLFNPAFDLDMRAPFRQPGLLAGYPGSSLLMVLGAYSYLFLCRYHFQRFPSSIAVCIFLIPAIFSSRTGLVLSIPIFLYLIFCQFSKLASPKVAFPLRLSPKIFGYLTALVILFSVIFNTKTRTSTALDYFFKPFALLTGASLNESPSAKALVESYSGHLTDFHFFFGNHQWMLTSRKENIDNGFFILLASQGLFSLIISCLYYLFLIFSIPRILPKSYLLFVFILFNLKADLLFVRQAADAFFCLVLSSSLFFRTSESKP